MEKAVGMPVSRNVAVGEGKQEDIGKLKREEKVEFVGNAKDQPCVWSRSKAAVVIVLIHCSFTSTVKQVEEGTYIYSWEEKMES